MSDHEHKFVELIKPGTKLEFIAHTRFWVGASLVGLLITCVMLPLNWKLRGAMLNWGIDFRGGTEMRVEFSKNVPTEDIRKALDQGGFPNSDVVSFNEPGKTAYLVRLGAVSVLSADKVKGAEDALRAKVGRGDNGEVLRKFEFSEGGDKVYVRFSKPVEPSDVQAALSGAGVQSQQVQRFGRPEDHTYEVVLRGMDSEVRRALEAKLGAGVVSAIPQVESVGAKAGRQLRDDGVKSLLYAILLIMVYIAVRFDFRYGPGTVVALVHDAVLTVVAFAITYKELSLTTLAAILTIIGFSMNDTIVVFDRIRENAAKARDRRFDRVVNDAINETLSRTVLTSATVFFVTLAMNIWGTGVVRDFAFAMNVGVIVGTYSSIFIASPVLIWLNAKMADAQKARKASAGSRPARGPRPSTEAEEV